MKQPSATFCIRPWTSLQITANGCAKVCCWTRDIVSEQGRPVSVYESSFQGLWNSTYMRSLRERMLSGEPVRECSHCYREEALSGASPRTLSNGAWFSDPAGRTPLQIAGESVPAGYHVAHGPSLIHLDFGNTCNLACRMCGADYSSRIENDPVHGKWSPRLHNKDLVEIRTGAANRFPTERYWYQQKPFLQDELLGDTENLRALYLIGGEPFLIKEVGDLLTSLLDKGLERTVGLTFSTNATLVPPDFLDKLSRFRSLHISLSLDGHGATYEYIRYPAKWDQVAANITTIRERLPRARLLVTPTLQAYNALTLVDLLRFCDRSGLEYQVSPLVEPDYLGLAVLPPEARARAAAGLRKYAKRRPPALALAERLESPAVPFDKALLASFVLFTNDLDSTRDQSLAKSLPKLYAILKKHGVHQDGRKVYARGGKGRLPLAVLARTLLRRLKAG